MQLFVIGVIGPKPKEVIAALSEQILPRPEQRVTCHSVNIILHHDVPQRTLYLGLQYSFDKGTFEQAAHGTDSTSSEFLKAALLLFLSSNAIIWNLAPGRTLDTQVLGTLRLLQQAKQLLLPSLQEFLPHIEAGSSDKSQSRESRQTAPKLFFLCQETHHVAVCPGVRSEVDGMQKKLGSSLISLVKRCRVILPEEHAAALCTLCPESGVWVMNNLWKNPMQAICEAFAAMRAVQGGAAFQAPEGRVMGLGGSSNSNASMLQAPGSSSQDTGKANKGGMSGDAPTLSLLRAALHEHAAEAHSVGLGFATWHQTFVRLAAALQCDRALGLPALATEQQQQQASQDIVDEGAAAALAWMEGCSALTYQVSEAKCRHAAAAAREAYLRSVPDIYPAAVHGSALQAALEVYWEQGARGPASREGEAGLRAKCEALWRDGRQQCQERSLWGHPCLLRPHNPWEIDHSSGMTYMLATPSGQRQVEVQDPFLPEHPHQGSSSRVHSGGLPKDGSASLGDTAAETGDGATTGQQQQQGQQQARGNEGHIMPQHHHHHHQQQLGQLGQQAGLSLVPQVQPGPPCPDGTPTPPQGPLLGQASGSMAAAPADSFPAASLLATIPLLVGQAGGAAPALPPAAALLGGVGAKPGAKMQAHPKYSIPPLGVNPSQGHSQGPGGATSNDPHPQQGRVPPSQPPAPPQAGLAFSGCFMEVHHLGPAASAQGGVVQPGFLPGCRTLHKFVLQVRQPQGSALDEEFPALGLPTKQADSAGEKPAIQNWPQAPASGGGGRGPAHTRGPPLDLGTHPAVTFSAAKPGQGGGSEPSGRGMAKKGRKQEAVAKRDAAVSPAVFVGLEYESLQGQRTILTPAQLASCLASSMDAVVVESGGGAAGKERTAGAAGGGPHSARSTHQQLLREPLERAHPATDALADAAAEVVGAAAAAASAARRASTAASRQTPQPQKPAGGPAAEFMLGSSVPLYLHLSAQQLGGSHASKPAGKGGRGSKPAREKSSHPDEGPLTATKPGWWQLRRIFIATPAAPELRLQACPCLQLEFLQGVPLGSTPQGVGAGDQQHDCPTRPLQGAGWGGTEERGGSLSRRAGCRGPSMALQYQPQHAVVLPPGALCCVTLPWLYTLPAGLAAGGSLAAAPWPGNSAGSRGGDVHGEEGSAVEGFGAQAKAQESRGGALVSSHAQLQASFQPIRLGTAPLRGMLVGGTALFPA